MASLQKHKRNGAISMLRHNDRTIRDSSNHDIDRSRTHLNYSLLTRDVSDREYYLQRLSQVHCHNRKDVNTMFSWVVTAPRDLAEEDQERFFRAATDFICQRYGEENICSSWAHLDEAQPHIHVLGVPVVFDALRGYEKVCADELITRNDLRSFHPQLQSYLDELGIEATVHSGITRVQGGNRTIAELKQNRAQAQEISHSCLPMTTLEPEERAPPQMPTPLSTDDVEHKDSVHHQIVEEDVWGSPANENERGTPTPNLTLEEDAWGTPTAPQRNNDTEHSHYYDLSFDFEDR